MTNAKGTKAGVQERVDLLTKYEPGTSALLKAVLSEKPRRDVLADDVLDALVGYVTARAPGSAIQRLQGSPVHDEHGLPIEMLYLSMAPEP
jgi:predicted RNase H-like nuclease